MPTSLKAVLGGGLGLPASKIKSKAADGPLNTQLGATVDARGVGVTVTVTGKVLLLGVRISQTTSNDTRWSLTCDGVVVSRQLTAFGGSTDNYILSNDTSLSVPIHNAPDGILCEAGFELFMQTSTDASISYSLIYTELN
jgi:hypothetical protein